MRTSEWCRFGTCLAVSYAVISLAGCHGINRQGKYRLCPNRLTAAAYDTYTHRHVATSDEGHVPPYYLPLECWAKPIRDLNPLYVYKHRINIVVVLQRSRESEEGLYLCIPVSSYDPSGGDDVFEFTEIDDGVYSFKRKLIR